jgi:hypothetical protein
MLVPMLAGHTYYIVVDGYDGDCGTYDLNIVEHEPCIACQSLRSAGRRAVCSSATGRLQRRLQCDAEQVHARDLRHDLRHHRQLLDGGRRLPRYRLVLDHGRSRKLHLQRHRRRLPLRMFGADPGLPPTSLGTVVANPCESASLNFTGPGTFYLFASTNGFTGVRAEPGTGSTSPVRACWRARRRRPRRPAWGALKVRYR